MITTAAEIRGLGVNVEDTKLAPYMSQASIKLKGWVGATAYADAETATPEDADRRASLKIAEQYLTLYFALPFLNLDIQGKVIGRFSSSFKNSVERESQPDIKSIREDMEAEAKSFAAPYMTSESPGRIRLTAI